jgi:hypothetical protein
MASPRLPSRRPARACRETEASSTDFSRANKDKVTQGEPKVRTERSAEEERLRKMMGKDD